MNGVLNVYKEQGFTSHDVVAKLRGILKTKKIGHTGTLDPDAVGVLPVCIGKATKLCDLITDWGKTYEAVMLLAQVRQEAADDLHIQGGGSILPGQLQQQALRQGPGAHAGGVQALEGLQRLLGQGLGDLQICHAVQVLLAEAALLVHQLCQIPGQGQQGLGQAPALQLVAKEGGEALRLPVRGAPVRHGAVAVLRQAAIDPVDLLPQGLIGFVEGGQISLLHQRVFFADLVQIVQQLLRIHLQDFHGLQ